MPEVSFLRNARNVTVDVTDESGKVLRVLDQQDYVRKEVPIEQSILAEVNWNWIWHGTNYNKVTGRSESLPEGQYYVNVRACADAKNAKQQLLTLPVKIDQTVPTVSATPVFTQGNTFQIEISAKDLGVVDSGASAALILALYDGDMRLVDCVSVERSIAAGKTETLSAMLSVPASGRYSAKIMVWNNLSDMESLTPCTWVSMS